MGWQFTADRPIFIQLAEAIRQGILTGAYPPGGDMPSVRALAQEAGVNPNTMQRALSELEGEGLLASQGTSGRTVTTDEALIQGLRDSIAAGCVESYFTAMASLGYGRDQAIEVFWARADGVYATPRQGREDGAGAGRPARPAAHDQENGGGLDGA